MCSADLSFRQKQQECLEPPPSGVHRRHFMARSGGSSAEMHSSAFQQQADIGQLQRLKCQLDGADRTQGSEPRKAARDPKRTVTLYFGPFKVPRRGDSQKGDNASELGHFR